MACLLIAAKVLRDELPSDELGQCAMIHSSEITACFSEDYIQARQKFLSACKTVRAKLRAYQNPYVAHVPKSWSPTWRGSGLMMPALYSPPFLPRMASRAFVARRLRPTGWRMAEPLGCLPVWPLYSFMLSIPMALPGSAA